MKKSLRITWKMRGKEEKKEVEEEGRGRNCKQR